MATELIGAAGRVAPGLATWALWGTAILMLAALAAAALRRAPAAARYCVWQCAMAGLLALPMLYALTPGIPLGLFSDLPTATAAESRPSRVAPINVAETPAPWTPPGATAADGPVAGAAQLETPSSSQKGRERPPLANSPANLRAPRTSTTVTSTGEQTSWQAIVTVAWATGVLLQLVLLARELYSARSLVRLAEGTADASLVKVASELAERFSATWPVEVLVTAHTSTPMVVGVRRPRILWPQQGRWSAAQQRMMLAHEVAHIARGDLLWQLVGRLAAILYWPNPLAWLALRQMKMECERSCDDRVLAAGTSAIDYAQSLVEMAQELCRSARRPRGGLAMADRSQLQRRVASLLDDSLAHEEAPRRLRRGALAATAAAVLVLALLRPFESSATGGQPTAAAGEKPAGRASEAVGPQLASEGRDCAIEGYCVDHLDNTRLPGVRVRLFKFEGRTAPPVELAETVTDAEGRFVFEGLEKPRPFARVGRLGYMTIAQLEGRPLGIDVPGMNPPLPSGAVASNIRLFRRGGTLVGRVVNERNEPVAGATVFSNFAYDNRPIPGVLSDVTDAEGRFAIDGIWIWEPPASSPGVSFTVVHPDYPVVRTSVPELPGDVSVKLPPGAAVSGVIRDEVANRPAAGVEVLFRSGEPADERVVATDAAGRYRVVLREGSYDVMVDAEDRVCAALVEQQFGVGEGAELPPLKLVAGGFITGQVVDTSTGAPLATTPAGDPIMIGLYGPGEPRGKVVHQDPKATVDPFGRFTLRAAPGENFPFFVNLHGERTAWTTLEQPPVLVKEGETTEYAMRFTPPPTAEDKRQAAAKVIDALPEPSAARAEAIIVELRKLNDSVDEPELWCGLIRELVELGDESLPAISAELGRTDENLMIRRLAFALRAIGDPRAIPTLIRAIPKTLQRPGSDYGLSVDDPELAEFMHRHDLREGGDASMYFNFGRPVREVFGALHKLSGENFGDDSLLGIHMLESPRSQAMQRRLFFEQAAHWQSWWNDHAHEFVDDPRFATMEPFAADVELPPAASELSSDARLSNSGVTGLVISPPGEPGDFVTAFYDIDMGRGLSWPGDLLTDPQKLRGDQLAAWAAASGVDLMCLPHRTAEGETFVLHGFDLRAWEINPRQTADVDYLRDVTKLPPRKESLLMHYDAASGQHEPEANAAFIVQTRDGAWCVLEITDRVTRTENLTGPFSPPPGVGFHRGVRLNVKEVAP